MNRNYTFAKISELLSEPESCKLGLEMVSWKELAITAREMCWIIQRSTLSRLRKSTLATYLMHVDSLTFNHELNNPSDEVSVAFDDWFEGKVVDARWKVIWKVDAHDDADYFDQKLTLFKMGVL